MIMRTWGALSGFALLAGALVLGPLFAARSSRADEATCGTYDAEYALAANLKLADTFMGAGDGVFRTGPGKVVLRWNPPEHERTSIGMVSYELHQPFVLSTHALLWSAKLTSDTTARATSDARGLVATGSLLDRTIRWDGPVSGYRVDGTIQCEGSLCGKFGAPPTGIGDVHIPARTIDFKSFELAPDRKTFTMDYVVVSHADSPKQTTLISLAGREMKRTCVARPQ